MFGSYIDELETYLDEIDKVSLCLFNTVVAILLYVDDFFFFLFESWLVLQRLLEKLYEFCIFSILDINISKTKILIFGHNERKLNQKAFYLVID